VRRLHFISKYRDRCCQIRGALLELGGQKSPLGGVDPSRISCRSAQADEGRALGEEPGHAMALGRVVLVLAGGAGHRAVEDGAPIALQRRGGKGPCMKQPGRHVLHRILWGPGQVDRVSDQGIELLAAEFLQLARGDLRSS
jgi:hypothetical protein